MKSSPFDQARSWLTLVWLGGPLAAVAAETGPVQATPKLSSGAGWAQWLLALILVFGALAAFFFLLRYLSGVGGLGSRHLKVLSGISLGARERVILLQAGNNKQLVLGVSPGRIQTLCVLEGDDRVPVDAPDEPAGDGASFARLFERLSTQKHPIA